MAGLHGHFEACVDILAGQNKRMACFSCFSMESGLMCFGNIRKRSNEYDELVEALEEGFSPPNQTELYHVQLRERRQKASETLSELD